MAFFSTNSYNNFQAANSKEYISLDKGAKQDFCPETCYNIILVTVTYFLHRSKIMLLSLDMDPCSTFHLTAMSMLLMQTPLLTKPRPYDQDLEQDK
jgi:hypothetical protein